MAAANTKLLAMIKKEGGAFASTILTEANKAGLSLALALAVVEQESDFKNIFGCDGQQPIDTAPWCHQEVTKDRVKALIAHVRAGGISNGVGLTQLTSIDLIEQAEANGGAHKPPAQCAIGFGLIHDLIARHGERTGLGCYNGGEGNPILPYADAVIGLKAKWQERIDKALKGTDATPASDSTVHRDLMVTTPFAKGPDIRVLQIAVNQLGREVPYADVKLKTDSQFGKHTAHACARVAYALGLPDSVCDQSKAGKVVQQTQQLIRDPSARSAEDKRRMAARKPILVRRFERQKQGAKAAIKWARSKTGTTEDPKGSNWGHPVQDWILFTGYGGPEFWCGCFVAYAVIEKGGAEVPTRIRLGLDTDINADAANGANGFERDVPPEDARPGDIATFSFRHIALVAGKTKDGMIHTIDGNSSASDGNDNNGGEVAEHRRSTSLVTCVGRLRY